MSIALEAEIADQYPEIRQKKKNLTEAYQQALGILNGRIEITNVNVKDIYKALARISVNLVEPDEKLTKALFESTTQEKPSQQTQKQALKIPVPEGLAPIVAVMVAEFADVIFFLRGAIPINIALGFGGFALFLYLLPFILRAAQHARIPEEEIDDSKSAVHLLHEAMNITNDLHTATYILESRIIPKWIDYVPHQQQTEQPGTYKRNEIEDLLLQFANQATIELRAILQKIYVLGESELETRMERKNATVRAMANPEAGQKQGAI